VLKIENIERCTTCRYTSSSVEHCFSRRRRWRRKLRRRRRRRSGSRRKWGGGAGGEKKGCSTQKGSSSKSDFFYLTVTMNMMAAVIRNVTPFRLSGVQTFRSILLPPLSTFMGVPLSAARKHYWQLYSRWSKAQEVHAVHPDEGSTNFQN